MQNRLFDRTFRSSPSFELVVSDRLVRSERQLLGDRIEEPGLYGLLRSREVGDSKVVDKDMALLFFTLQSPGPLPDFLRREMEPTALHRWIRGLVAAGVFEVEVRGEFISRGLALNALETLDGTNSCRASAGPSRLQRLSHAALETAAALPEGDLETWSRWLYSFNHQPLTPRWTAEMATSSIEHWLGLEGELGSRLDLLGEPGLSDTWASWTLDRPQNQGRGVTYKLYISPVARDLPVTLERVAASLGRIDAFHCKVARTLPGILRADKLVLYFADFDRLGESSRILGPLLGGIEPQGVPFTADVVHDGLLSWGIDPPRSGQWQGEKSQSWRRWITDRLAWALGQTLGEASSGETRGNWRGALDLLALEGVDPETWAPDPGRWQWGES